MKNFSPPLHWGRFSKETYGLWRSAMIEAHKKDVGYYTHTGQDGELSIEA